MCFLVRALRLHEIDFSDPSNLADASIHVFDMALCLRCNFSTLILTCPLHFQLRGRSLAVGKDEILLSSQFQKLSDWTKSPSSAGGSSSYLRSPCGRLFLAAWGDDSITALYVTLHYTQCFWAMTEGSEAWDLLAKAPEADDVDSAIGLHDYSVLLTLRSGKAECFSNSFYKVDQFGLGSNKSGFGGVRRPICSTPVFEVAHVFSLLISPLLVAT